MCGREGGRQVHLETTGTQLAEDEDKVESVHVWQGGVLTREGYGAWLSIRAGLGTHLREATVEAGCPATFGAGGPTAQALATQDAIAALGVGAPGQVGAAFYVATQEGLLVL